MLKNLLIISVLIASINNLFSANKLTNQEKEILNVKTEKYEDAVIRFKELYNKDVTELKKYKHFQRWNYFWGNRLNSEGTPDMNEILNEIYKENNKLNQNQLLTSEVTWEAFGPSNSPINDEGLGRINVVKFHPQNSRIIYIGSASGGAWVSKNNGETWSLLPTTDFLSLSIADIEICKNNPNVIYIATSDPNSASGISGPVYGIGLIKSTDGGNTFAPTSLKYNLDNQTFATSIVVHPEDENIIWVGTDNGVVKSTDGGDTFINLGPQIFVKDLELHPTNPDIIYAGAYIRSQDNARVYKSDEGGEKWKLVQSYSGAVRTELAVTPAMPNRVVSIVSQSRPYSYHSYNISDDSGETWKVQSDKDNHANVLGRNHGAYPAQNTTLQDQGWYDLCVAVSPTNPNFTIVGGIWLWGSANAGVNFQEYVESYHVDQHYLEFSPSGDTVYIGNDGGLYRFIPKTNEYEFISEGMNITQFYKMSVNQDNLNMVIAGAQDNNTMLKRANGNWYNVRGGDGMDCHFDPKDPNYVYASSQNGNFGYSTNGGNNFRQCISSYNTNGEEGAWVTPFAVDPIKTGYVYAGYYNVWRNTNHGQSTKWEKISDFGTSSSLKILTIAPSNSDYIYASEGGTIRFTSNGGQSWSNIPSPGGTVSDIEVNPSDPAKIYASLSNYNRLNKVFEYDPTSKKWNNMTGNLPNVPVNSIKYQANSPERLFVGTDIGVYYTDYNSRYWERYGEGLPFTLVSDIEILEESNKIFISTYGRGIWSTDLIDCNSEKLEIFTDQELEFCFGDSIKLELLDDVDPNNVLWSTGEKGKSIWVKDKGSYSVSLKENDGCTSKSNYIEVNTISVSDVNLKSSRGEFICQNDSTKLTANFGHPEYIWENGETGLSRWVYEPGTYSIKVRNKNGCFSFDTITIKEFIVEKPEIELIDSVLSTDAEGFLQWYYNGEYVEGANSSTFRPIDKGEVMVEARENGCNEFSDSFFYEYSSVDYSDYFKIFPNPTNGIVNISLSEKVITDITFEIIDLNGNNIDLKSSKINKKSNQIQINISELINGTYILNLKFNNQKFTSKIILNK